MHSEFRSLWMITPKHVVAIFKIHPLKNRRIKAHDISNGLALNERQIPAKHQTDDGWWKMFHRRAYDAHCSRPTSSQSSLAEQVRNHVTTHIDLFIAEMQAKTVPVLLATTIVLERQIGKSNYDKVKHSPRESFFSSGFVPLRTPSGSWMLCAMGSCLKN